MRHSVCELNWKKSFSLALQSSKLAIIPCSTIYGISCLASSVSAIEKLYKVKRKKLSQGQFSVLFSSLSQIKQYCMVSTEEEKIIKKYFPGDVTIVLRIKLHSSLPKKFYPNGIGCRILPNSSLINSVISKIGPITATSANIHKKEVCRSIGELKHRIISRCAIIKDVGILNNLPTTICKIVNNKIEILRQGKIKIL